MRLTLLHLFGILLFVLYPNISAFSNTNTYCKYNDDPIIVDKDQQREKLQLSGTQNLITLCNLKVGETYTVSGFSPVDVSCMFRFDLFGATLAPEGQNTAPSGQDKLTFKALSSCMDIEVNNNNCTNQDSYPVNLSIICSSCAEESSVSSLLSNIVIDPGYSAEQLISDIFIGGDCFDVSNVTGLGSSAGRGFFSNGTVVGIPAGVILSSGNVTSAPGPSNVNASSATSPNNANDPDLLTLSGNGTMHNCNGIEFDFIPTLDSLTFEYVFASEEYCEWVGQYNDAFGFFLSGPGISGPFSNGAENIALVTGTNTEVAINTVNHITNSAYFWPNDNNCGGITNGNDIAFDGFTHVFTSIVTGLVACETYHIKLVVGDANDQIFDSAVFLKGKSFDAGGSVNAEGLVPGTNGNVAIEACQDGEFYFFRGLGDASQDLVISYTVGGTATPDVDYAAIPNFITIPAGEYNYTLFVDIFPDALAEGSENITIVLDLDACSCLGQVAEIIIEDVEPLVVEGEMISECGPETNTLSPTITGGAPTFTYSWSNNQTSPTITVSPSQTTTYTVTVTDQCGSTEEGTFTITVESEPTATLSGNSALCEEDPNPSATLTITFTGTGPWDLTYLFNGSPTTITGIIDNPYDLIVNNAGTYTLGSVENAACPGTVSGSAVITVVDVELSVFSTDVACNGESTGSIDITPSGGDPVYTYSWDTGPETEDLNNISVGTYNVTVTDANGCTETASAQISEPPVLNSVVNQTAQIFCNGDNTAAVDLQVSGGSPGYFYLWSNGSQVEDPAQLTAGTYTVTVTDLNNCTSESSITIDQPDAILVDAFVMQNVSCFGGNDGWVDLTVTGGSFPYFYNWSNNGGFNEDPNDLYAESYTVTVTDVYGCTTVAGVSISEPPPILTQVLQVLGVDCNNPNGGWVDLTLGGGTPNYSYEWDNGSTLQDPNNLSAGLHTVTVTDALGCTATDQITISSDTIPPTAAIDVDGIITCVNVSVNLDGSGSSGNGNLSYEWQDANGTVISTAPFTDVTTAGEYTLIVTNDDNGCTASSSAMVDQNAEVPTADAEVSGILDCINVSATLDGSGSTGNGTLEYEWQNSGGATIGNQVSTDVSAPDTYTLIITDSDNGCTSSAMIVVDQDIVAPTPDAQASGLLTCDNTTVTLTGSGSTGNGTISYEWFDDNNAPLGGNANIDVTQSGTYTLVITDSQNGCTAETTVDVNQNIDVPTAEAQVSGILTCVDLMATLDGSNSTGTGTIGYEWLDAGGSSVGTAPQLDTDIPGQYTLIITDIDNGCTAETSIEVFQNIEDPTALASVNDALNCQTTSVTVDGSGSSANGTISYEWLDPGATSIGNTAQVDVSAPGIYTLIITDTENGCTQETTIEVLQNIDVPNPDAIADGILTCDNVDVTLDGSGSSGTGGLDYEWFDSNGTSISQNDNVAVTTPDTYTLVITDIQNGCTAETSLLIDQDIAAPTPDAQASGLLTCDNTTVTLTGSGSTGNGTISYEWFDGNNDPLGGNANIDVTQSGTYTLVITDSQNGCTAETTVDVNQNIDVPTAEAQVSGILTCVDIMATLDGNNSTGTGTLAYEWLDAGGSSVGTAAQLDTDIPGQYTLIITDIDNGCTAETSIEVFQNIEDPIALAAVNDALTCVTTVVTVDGSSSSANGTVSYEWLDPGSGSIGNTAQVDVSTPGIYTLIITDTENGCTQEATVEVLQNIVTPNPDAVADGILTCGNVDVSLDGSGSSGAGGLDYEWFDSNGTSIGQNDNIAVTAPDTYTLVITDIQNGCTSETSLIIDQDITPPSADAGPGTSLTCQDTQVTLDGSASSTGANISYQWLNNGNVPVGNTISVDVTQTGTYTLVVTNDDNGCTASSTVTVTPDANLPTADAGTGSSLTCVVDQVTLDGSGSSSGANISYQWFDANNTPISNALVFDVNQIGTYTLVVTNDDNGCSASSSVAINEDMTPPNADAGTVQFITCTTTQVTLDGSGSTGSNLTYQWLDAGGTQVGTTATVTVSSAEEYTLIVTNNDNGCTGSDAVEVQLDSNVPVSDAGPDGLLNCNVLDYTLDGSNSTGGTLEYDWQDPSGTTISTSATVDVAQSGIYTLIITDTDNGCTSTSTAFVDQDIEAPVADAGTNGLLTCAITSTELNASASTANGTLAYQWEDAGGTVIGNTDILSATQTGIYTVIVTNQDNGCTAMAQVEVMGDFEAPIADAGADGLLTCDVTNTILDGSASSANGTIAYEWFDQNNTSLANTVTLDVNQTGTYTLVITNQDNGCTESSSVIVDENIVAPSSNAGQSQTLTCADTEVTLSGSGTSQSGNMAFEWLSPAGASIGNQSSITVSQTGTYTLVVTDTDNGCTMASTVQVVPDANLPNADAGASSTLTCDLTVTTLDGTNSSASPDISYDWQDANGTSIGTSLSLDVANPGIYTLIVFDASNGCTASSSVEIFENTELPNTEAGTSPTLTCADTETTLDGSGSSISSGGLVYEWADPQGAVIANTATVIVDQPGMYTLTTTGDNGCSTSDQVEVMSDTAIPVSDAGPGGILDCNISVVTLGGNNTSAGPAFSYEWQDGTGATIANTATTDISVPGDYILTVINSDNGCQSSAAINIPQDIEAPAVDAGPTATLTCDLTVYEIGGSGSSAGAEYTYEWTSSNGTVISTDISTDISIPDTYTLLITDTSNGCTSSEAVVISQDIDTPVSDAGQGGVLTCDVSTITLDGSNSSGSNLAYTWLNGSGVIVSNAAIFDASETGDYTLVVTNTANGCFSESMASITPDDNLPTVLASPDGILTCVNNDVFLDGSGSSSISGNISFEWLDDSQNTVSTIDNYNTSVPGIYTLIVTDTDNGCTSSTTLEVLQDIADPTSDAGPLQTLICGQTDVTLVGTGGNGNNLTYEWQDDQATTIGTASSVTVNSAGTYTLIVTNTDNGCSASSNVDVVPDMNLPTANAGTAANLTCTVTTITLDGAGSSTGANFSYEWQDENGVVVGNILTVDVSTPGIYTLFVLDNDNNCESQDQVTVVQDIEDPTAVTNTGSATSLDCNNTSLALDGSGSVPAGELTFLWTTADGNIVSGPNTINPEIDQPGTYTLVVTNTTNGCTDSQQITINQDIIPPVVLIQTPEILTCAVTEVTIDATQSSSNGNYSYAWTGSGIVSGANTLTPVVNLAGTIICTITDNDNGCETTGSITINENTIPPVAITSTNEEFDCVTESISLNGEGSSTGSQFSYLWSGNGTIDNETTLNPTVYQPGVYSLLVTDANNGCTQSSSVLAPEDPNMPSSISTLVEDPLCFGDRGSITVSDIIGGTPPYLVSLDGGNSFGNQTLFANLDPGNYDLVIQDALGCEISESLTIQAVNELTVDVETEVLLQFGDSYEIVATINIPMDEVDTIIWSPTTGLSCTDCLRPTVDTILQMAVYNVTVINENGCVATDQIHLRVNKDKDVYIPNAFSPGKSDGFNDYLTVFGNSKRINKINSFQVYNRWGELVYQHFNFQPNNPTEGWDGKFRGQLVNPAVFVYWAEVEFVDGSKEIFKGDVTVVE